MRKFFRNWPLSAKEKKIRRAWKNMPDAVIKPPRTRTNPAIRPFWPVCTTVLILLIPGFYLLLTPTQNQLRSGALSQASLVRSLCPGEDRTLLLLGDGRLVDVDALPVGSTVYRDPIGFIVKRDSDILECTESPDPNALPAGNSPAVGKRLLTIATGNTRSALQLRFYLTARFSKRRPLADILKDIGRITSDSVSIQQKGDSLIVVPKAYIRI